MPGEEGPEQKTTARGTQWGTADDAGNTLTTPDVTASASAVIGVGASGLIWRGIPNGDFSLGPPDPNANLSASNALPYWTVTNVGVTKDATAQWVADSSYPSGRKLRCSFPAGSTATLQITSNYIYIPSDASADAEVLCAIEAKSSAAAGTIDMEIQTFDAAFSGGGSTPVVNHVGITGTALTRYSGHATGLVSSSVQYAVFILQATGGGGAAQTIDIVTVRQRIIDGLAPPFIQTVRQTVGGAIAAGASRTDTVSWPVPFYDTNYTVSVTPLKSGFTAGVINCEVVSVLAAGVTIRTLNNDSASRTPVLHLIAIHD